MRFSKQLIYKVPGSNNNNRSGLYRRRWLTLWKDGVVEGHKTISLDLSGDISLADVSNLDVELNVYDFYFSIRD